MASAKTIRSIRTHNTAVRRSWPVALRLAGIPEPVRGCDGATWQVPFWNPETREWELQAYDVERPGPVRILPRAQCGIPGCDALHREEYERLSREAKERGHY